MLICPLYLLHGLHPPKSSARNKQSPHVARNGGFADPRATQDGHTTEFFRTGWEHFAKKAGCVASLIYCQTRTHTDHSDCISNSLGSNVHDKSIQERSKYQKARESQRNAVQKQELWPNLSASTKMSSRNWRANIILNGDFPPIYYMNIPTEKTTMP